MSTTAELTKPRSWLALALFLAIVIGVGGLIGSQTNTGEWYQSLNKPPFNPPSWLFAPVWFTLYAMIAVAGWRTWTLHRTSTAMTLWFGQLLLNWAWTPTFFMAHLLWPAFAIIIALLVLVVLFILITRHYDKLSAWLFVPYALWVGFASLLNLWIAVTN
jgi:tryptophan-rich sensory protein